MNYDVSGIIKFIWTVLQYGGLAIAAIGALVFILAKRNNNDDLSTGAIWIVLGGLVAAAVGAFMNTQTVPTL